MIVTAPSASTNHQVPSVRVLSVLAPLLNLLSDEVVSAAGVVFATPTGLSTSFASVADRPTARTAAPASKSNKPPDMSNGPPVFGRPAAGAARLGVAPAWAGAAVRVAVGLGTVGEAPPLVGVGGSAVGVALGVAVGV